MKISSFGRFMRNYRMDHGILLGTMAKTLGVSSSYLSAIEYGNKKIPDDLYKKIVDNYQFSENECVELDCCINMTNEMVGINLKNTTENQGETAILFARRLKNLDNDTLNTIRAILEEKKK